MSYSMWNAPSDRDYYGDDLYDEQDSGDRCIICGHEHEDRCEFCRQCPSMCECEAKLDELAEQPTPEDL